MTTPRSVKFVLEFGSHLRNPEARDIDILYGGISEEEAKNIVRSHYPDEQRLPIDAFPVGEYQDILVPVPCDSQKIEHVFLWISETGVEPIVNIKRYYDTIAAILREGAGWQEAYRRLQEKKNIEIPLEERYDGDEYPSRLINDDYTSGRLSMVKAARDHFGEDNLILLCEKLWWGSLLKRLILEKPNEVTVKEIRGHSGSFNAARLYARNDKNLLYTQYGRETYSANEAIDWLYPKSV